MNHHNANQLRLVFGRIDDLVTTMKNALDFWGLCMMLLACSNGSMAQSENHGFIVNLGDTVPDFTLTDLDGRIHYNKTLLGKPTFCNSPHNGAAFLL